jgi:prepilin-type N-terminal cleavage/methylation domain-containing protein/prepilin-type processing-associated H-X9-DG protein
VGSQRRGFTLVELLVVTGIMAVLIAITVPAYLRAAGVAQSTTCQTNLRQWATALRLYAQQNLGALPRRGQGMQPTAVIDRPEDWFNALPAVMGCPSYKTLAAEGRIPHPGDDGIWICPSASPAGPRSENYFAYGMNMRLSTWMTGTPDYLDSFRNPSTEVFMADGPGPYGSVLPSSKGYSPVARHNGCVNVSFLDGHVESFDGDYIGCDKGDPRRPDVQWLVPDSAWPGPP